jgi:hypothetical protein
MLPPVVRNWQLNAPSYGYTSNGSFTLAKFVSKTISDSDTQQSRKSHVTVTAVLALATLGSMITNRNAPISVTLPKVAKVSTSMFLLHVVVTSIITLTREY